MFNGWWEAWKHPRYKIMFKHSFWNRTITYGTARQYDLKSIWAVYWAAYLDNGEWMIYFTPLITKKCKLLTIIQHSSETGLVKVLNEIHILFYLEERDFMVLLGVIFIEVKKNHMWGIPRYHLQPFLFSIWIHHNNTDNTQLDITM